MTESVLWEPQSEACKNKIPIRNLWLLMFYASDLFRIHGLNWSSLEEAPDNIPDLIAEMLASLMEKRLKRNLSYGFCRQEAERSRVRGRIDILKTESHQLLARAKVACQFDQLTVDTVRNRLFRAALESISKIVQKRALRLQCRSLASALAQLGVGGQLPRRDQILGERYSRHEREDALLVSVALLALDLRLISEEHGRTLFSLPDKDPIWLRKLYERAVGGFYSVVLPNLGWKVEQGKRLYWLITEKSDRIDSLLPSMITDIYLTHLASGNSLIVDTKFNQIMTKNQFGHQVFRSGYIYQIYAYIRSQEVGASCGVDHAAGLLLHPSFDENIYETVTIQGHPIRFATVDLMQSTKSIREQLLQAIEGLVDKDFLC